MLELPTWRDEITEEDHQRMQRRPSASLTAPSKSSPVSIADMYPTGQGRTLRT